MERKRSLKGLRTDLGITQSEMAKMLGMPQPRYCGIENLNEATCAQIADILKVKSVEVVITE